MEKGEGLSLPHNLRQLRMPRPGCLAVSSAVGFGLAAVDWPPPHLQGRLAGAPYFSHTVAVELKLA